MTAKPKNLPPPDVDRALADAARQLQEFAEYEVEPYLVQLVTRIQSRITRRHISIRNSLYGVMLVVAENQDTHCLCGTGDPLWKRLARRFPELEEIATLLQRAEDELHYCCHYINPEKAI